MSLLSEIMHARLRFSNGSLYAGQGISHSATPNWLLVPWTKKLVTAIATYQMRSLCCLLLAAEAPLPASANLPAKIPDLSPKSTFTDMTLKTGVV